VICPQPQITPAKSFLSKCYRTSFGLERYLLIAGRATMGAKNSWLTLIQNDRDWGIFPVILSQDVLLLDL